MGFNIGVFSDQTPENFECSHFIGRSFYNFVNSGEQYFDHSILIQSGQYYGLDLSPLLKLVYTWDEVTDDYVRANTQNIDNLLDLVVNFRDRIDKDNFVCSKISYVWYDHSEIMSEEDIQDLTKEIGEDAARPLLELIDQKRREIEENPNPWKWYFEDKQIVDDLNNLMRSLQCYKDKGVTEIYLTAG